MNTIQCQHTFAILHSHRFKLIQKYPIYYDLFNLILNNASYKYIKTYQVKNKIIHKSWYRTIIVTKTVEKQTVECLNKCINPLHWITCHVIQLSSLLVYLSRGSDLICAAVNAVILNWVCQAFQQGREASPSNNSLALLPNIVQRVSQRAPGVKHLNVWRGVLWLMKLKILSAQPVRYTEARNTITERN